MPLARHRRRLVVGSAALIGVAVLATGAGSTDEPAHARIALYSDGVALDADGVPRLVPVGEDVADDPGQRSRQDEWLAGGHVPGPPRYRAMAEQALRDLDALVLDNGASLAAGSPYWRYVWPRDASFTAAALARTGHADDAHAVLAYLALMQERSTVDGVLQARYLPDGSGGVPDARPAQLDGSGWVLWGVAEWYASAGPDRVTQLEELRRLVVAAIATIRAQVDPATGLPAAFPDYWEVAERRPTLGTVAPLLAGTRAAAPVLAALGEPPVGDLVALLERGVEGHFAPHYPRRLGGTAQDTAVAWLMPPFGGPDPQVTAAWQDAAAGMARPAGGLAPGEDWKRDGVSWTPETAMWALTAAASGDVDQATRWLDWLDRHRTARGSLPEKVLHDGSPAAVAPLAWTASTVLLALDELDRQGAGSTS